MAPSGSGKTTLLRLMNRIEQADSGTIEGLPKRIGTVFQEDRLCEEYDVITNIMLIMKCKYYKKQSGKKEYNKKAISKRENNINETKHSRKAVSETIKKEASRILPEECLTKKASELSGGMRRRCAILRALLSDSELIIMDEPFTGLDDENRRKTAEYILDNLNGRTLIVTTHREEDVELLGAVKVDLEAVQL
ncbi:MAG: ATP-binding cassette domain-containing protein [Butyrivibrio sp.]|nr:ATP-binding cassette domain-containing protein [Butyrivibrio sp.]